MNLKKIMNTRGFWFQKEHSKDLGAFPIYSQGQIKRYIILKIIPYYNPTEIFITFLPLTFFKFMSGELERDRSVFCVHLQGKNDTVGVAGQSKPYHFQVHVIQGCQPQGPWDGSAMWSDLACMTILVSLRGQSHRFGLAHPILAGAHMRRRQRVHMYTDPSHVILAGAHAHRR